MPNDPQQRVDQPQVGSIGYLKNAAIDVNALIDGSELKLSPSETPEDARHRRHRDLVAFYAALVMLAVVFAFAMVGIISPSTGAEDKKWYFAIVGAMVGSVATYLFKSK